MRNCDTETKFLQEQRLIVRRFKERGYTERVLSAIRKVKFAERRYYLERTSKRHIERPLPFNTDYFRFSQSLNGIFNSSWTSTAEDYWLWTLLPTSPFVMYRNHLNIGQYLSHKRHFDSCPSQANLQPGSAVVFQPQCVCVYVTVQSVVTLIVRSPA